MEKEIWKPVIENDEYEVSSMCRFRTLKPCKKGGSPKILKQHICKTGYYCVGLYQGNGKQRVRKSNRLFAQVFIQNPLKLPQVNHKDGNKLNNSLDNLEWVTNKQNSEHAWKTGLINRQFGEKTSKAVLTNKDAIDIINSNKTDKELANIYNVHSSTINNIKCGKNRSDITKVPRRFKEKVNVGVVLKIFNSTNDDATTAKEYGVCRQHVNAIKSGLRYSEITGKVYQRKQKVATKITRNIVMGIKSMRHLKLKDSMIGFNVSESVVVKIRAGKFDHLI